MPDVILSSDAPRALETAEVCAKTLNYQGPEIILNETIYATDNAESLFQIFKDLDEKYNSAIMFGHDPTLSALARMGRLGWELVSVTPVWTSSHAPDAATSDATISGREFFLKREGPST